MSQRQPVDGIKWFEDTSQFNKDFMENYNEDSDERYFIYVEVQCPEKLHDLPFLRESMKIQKVDCSKLA